MSEPLSDVDVRVLGSLIEKEQTTPEYYPLSLNALVNACNQASNRDPVVKYDEATVTRSIDALRQRGLIRATRGIDARVMKYAHRVDDVMGLNIREIAVLCVLMLRGAQTPGELRIRTARIESFDDLGEVETTLHALMVREMVMQLPRQPGQKELRYAHLLAGEINVAAHAEPTPTGVKPGSADRLSALERTVDELRSELSAMRAELEEFRRQFE